MAQYPKAPEGPLELFENKHLTEDYYTSKYWGASITGALVFVGVCVANWYSNRPPFVGIQKHIGLSAIAALIGHYVDGQRTLYFAERDAVYRHYMSLHQEEFPNFERKKYADVFEAWIPTR